MERKLKKHNIAIICEYKLFPSRIGGMDYFFKAFDTALKEKGHTVTWFFKDIEFFDFYKNLHLENANGSAVEQYFLMYLNTHKELQFNMVITHFLQPVSSFFKKVKKLGNPYIINVDHNPRPLNGFPLKKRIKNRLKGMLYGKYVDQLVGVSAYTEYHILNDFGKHLKNKTTTVYNGIDVSLYKSNKIDRTVKPIKCIVVSHLRASKGIQDLLKAVSLLPKDLQKELLIDIFGEGPYEKELKAMQKKFKLERLVNFKGSSPKINELLPTYHYLIQPTYMECFSLSILESLACNVPVITTTVGGNLEVITNEDNGYIFKPKDVPKLKLIIEQLITGEKAIVKDVATVVEKNYTLNKMVQNHLNLLP